MINTPARSVYGDRSHTSDRDQHPIAQLERVSDRNRANWWNDAQEKRTGLG